MAYVMGTHTNAPQRINFGSKIYIVSQNAVEMEKKSHCNNISHIDSIPFRVGANDICILEIDCNRIKHQIASDFHACRFQNKSNIIINTNTKFTFHWIFIWLHCIVVVSVNFFYFVAIFFITCLSFVACIKGTCWHMSSRVFFITCTVCSMPFFALFKKMYPFVCSSHKSQTKQTFEFGDVLRRWKWQSLWKVCRLPVHWKRRYINVVSIGLGYLAAIKRRIISPLLHEFARNFFYQVLTHSSTRFFLPLYNFVHKFPSFLFFFSFCFFFDTV